MIRTQKINWRYSWIIILIGIIFFPLRGAQAQNDTPWAAEAQALMETMSVEERVGQLFLVTFTGDTALPESDIADLIHNYHVSGVVLLSENDNITNSDQTATQVSALTNQLQQIALQGIPPEELPENETDIPFLPSNAPTPDPTTNAAIPLLVATVYEGDGAPNTEILSGLTNIPNQMAIGATWDPEFSYDIGRIVGTELSAIGINLLLGPSLDVLEDPLPFNRSDLGTRTFGGDPFWVGLMGQSYTAGLHDGSNSRMAVIAKHFPGFGSSDRPINEEVGTVRKSLEQLKQIELAPFFAVTGNAIDPASTVDGLLTAHIRYQGFQGNIRDTTAPVSFDPQALTSLMQLPEFSTWRQNGGIVVSDSLGALAVQRFYEDTGQEFPHRLVAKDALLAGNDLLYLSNFAIGENADYSVQLANMKDTVTWFQERYETDPTFRNRTDQAVLRVLQLKLKLYNGDFSAENVLLNPDESATPSQEASGVVFDLAQEAITLIAPSPAEITQVLPPSTNDNIVIFTDVRQTQQCSTCPLESMLDVEALQNRILALYGPQASNQVRPEQLSSYSFENLEEYLQNAPIFAPTITNTITPEPGDQDPGIPTATPIPTPTTSPAFFVQDSLASADWIIFAILNPDPNIPGSQAIHQFLETRPEIGRDARIIVFAYNAPYYLDTTEISRLTAYFGVYSRIDRFVDASVRALFQESSLQGRPPVNVPGISYDLFEVTQPDPSQVIELFIVDEGLPQSPPSEAPLEVVPGATLRLQTGIIRDHNGNVVPDGSLVQFVQQDRIQGFVNVITERPTIGGVANLDYLLEARTGNFRITATSGEATTSQEINIVIGENAVVSINTPTPGPTSIPEATATPTSSITPSPTPTETPTPTPSPSPTAIPDGPKQPPDPPDLTDEIQMLLAITGALLITGGTGFFIGRNGDPGIGRSLRWALWGLAGGLLAYNYFALNLPGAELLENLGLWAGFIITLIGGIAGLAIHRWVASPSR